MAPRLNATAIPSGMPSAMCLGQWEIRGKVRDNLDAVFHARIIAYMAGAEGEVVLLGSTRGATVTI
jgi:hypothetical protein